SLDRDELGSELPGRELCAKHAGADLLEGGLTSRRGIVAEGRESAVVGRTELCERDVLGRLEHTVAYFLCRLDPRVDWIDHADEDPLSGRQVRFDDLQHLAPVLLARELDVEV